MAEEDYKFNVPKTVFGLKEERVRKYMEEHNIFSIDELYDYGFGAEYDNKPEVKSGILEELKLYLKRREKFGWLKKSQTNPIKYKKGKPGVHLEI